MKPRNLIQTINAWNPDFFQRFLLNLCDHFCKHFLFFWLTPKGIFSNEPTLYLPITVSSNASLNLLLFLSVTTPQWSVRTSGQSSLQSHAFQQFLYFFLLFPDLTEWQEPVVFRLKPKNASNNKVVNSFFMVIRIYLNWKFSIYGLTNRYFLQSAFFICLPLNTTLSNVTFCKGNSRLTPRTWAGRYLSPVKVIFERTTRTNFLYLYRHLLSPQQLVVRHTSSQSVYSRMNVRHPSTTAKPSYIPTRALIAAHPPLQPSSPSLLSYNAGVSNTIQFLKVTFRI